MAKLTKNDWLDHALEELAENGFTVLKADVLAKSLGVSRGSFYHHFEDLATFHRAVLNRWLEVSSLAVATELEGSGLPPTEKMSQLVSVVAAGTTRLEQAVRAWAFSSPEVAATVGDVDRARMDYIVQVLREGGIDAATAQRRGVLLYLSNVGYSFLADVLKPVEQKRALADVTAYANA